MDSITLTSREILYIASTCGADEFWGIPDGFYGMDEAEITAEINSIKLSLTNKGYARMNFDGEFEIADGVKEIILVCAERDKYISFDKSALNKDRILRFYIKGDRIFRITEEDNSYLICQSAKNAIKKSLLDFAKWSEEKQLPEESAILENEFLRKVKAMNELDNPVAELKLMGCDNVKAKILYEGLSGFADFYSLMIIDFTAENDELQSLMFIHSDDGTLELEPLRESEDKVQIKPIVFENVACEISGVLSKILPDTEVSFV